jgi:hypothetical protein
MANPNNPHGFAPTMRNIFGGPVQAFDFVKPASVATAIFQNDIVSTVTGAGIQPGRSTALVGVALNYGAANVLTNHLVVIDPKAILEAQDNDGAVGILAADLGKNANISIAVAGNVSNGISGQQIDKSTVATTSTLDVQLIALHGTPENAFGPNARIQVILNRSFFDSGRTGV